MVSVALPGGIAAWLVFAWMVVRLYQARQARLATRVDPKSRAVDHESVVADGKSIVLTLSQERGGNRKLNRERERIALSESECADLGEILRRARERGE